VWGSGKDVFVVGDAGTILRTSDGGKTWARLASGTRADLHGVWGSSAKDLYVVGDGNLVLHSSDGGKSWKASNPPTGVVTALEGVWGSGPKDVYVVGVNGAVAHSGDGGKTWVSQNVQGQYGYPTLYAVWGTGAKDVWAAGEQGNLWHTTDGGKTWLAAGRSGGAFHGVTAAAGGVVAIGDNGRVVTVAAGDGKTDEPKPPVGAFLQGVWSQGGTVIAVGQAGWSKAANAQQSTILRSTDGAKTWTPIANPGREHLVGVWSDGKIAWAVGAHGLILRSADGGATWSEVSSHAIDGEVRGFASGGKVIVAAAGQLARSTDGGKTWQAIASAPGWELSVAATADGFVAIGGSGTIVRSTDGGVTWKPTGGQAPKTPPHALAAAGKALVAVGEQGAVVRSDDGGTTWKAGRAGTDALRAVWTDGKTWWTVGDREALFTSTDAGASWTPVKGPGKRYDFTGVWSDGSAVVIVGVDAPHDDGGEDMDPPHAIVLRSTDGGKSWVETRFDDNYGLTAVSGAGAEVWAVGRSGLTLHSSDHGKTWKRGAAPTGVTCTAVWSDGKSGVIVGGENGEAWRGK
jgi:photosystem II stability/assembly factor-like uncharacterized protein